MSDVASVAAPTSRTFVSMSTLVTLRVVADADVAPGAVAHALDRAQAWFDHVEATCSRFDPASELSRLCRQPGQPVLVSPTLFRALEFALAVADDTDGAFDPTLGARLEALGFDVEHRSGRPIAPPHAWDPDATWRDIELGASGGTVRLARPLLLDLGAVAKGLAIDLAARELGEFSGAAIDAGGDIRVLGVNDDGDLWRIGIRHPRRPAEVIETLRVRDAAVCTSGDSERRSPRLAGEHHLLDPGSGRSAQGLASVTVRAASAIVADALSTAAFVAGIEPGRAWLERHGAEGLFVTTALERVTTAGW